MNSFSLLCLGCLTALNVCAATPGKTLLWAETLEDPETIPAIAKVEAVGGEWTGEGWRATTNGEGLRLVLADPAPANGELRVEVRHLDWLEAGASNGPDRKMHFINLFSNPLGDHHAEDGGTPTDALISLRAGADDDGGLRYPRGFKVLYASRGAKRAPESDYHEQVARTPEDWEWRDQHVFWIRWSQAEDTLRVGVDDTELLSLPWEKEGDPFRYIDLARSRDFATWVGPVFTRVELYALNPVPETTAAPESTPAP